MQPDLSRRAVVAASLPVTAAIAERMPEARTAALPGVRLAYRDAGGSGPPLVLLHANTGTSASWAETFTALSAAGYRVIAPDRRGWGGSIAEPSTGPQPGSIADDLAALAESLGLPTFHLLGVAGGGFAALDYAGWKPETLRTLTVAASQGSFSEPEMQRLVDNIGIPGFRELPETFREIGPSFRALHPDRVAAWAHAQEAARQPGATAQPLRTPNTFAKLAVIRMPVLAISASADLLAPPALMAAWIRHIPQAETVTIADSGHCVAMEQPVIFHRVVLDFLSRHR